jgi:glycosyltransferase involved in cell wall biosynthesis
VPGGCEQILCVSRFVRDALGDTTGTAVASARVSVIHDGVPWAEPGAELGNPASVDSREDSQRVRLGFVGRLVHVKGVDILVQALARVPVPRRPLLLVAGADTEHGGAYERWLRQLAASLGVADDIVWLGFVDDITQLYRQVDAVACPSRMEALGLVPLEAAQFAVPVLASDVGGFPEVIQHGHNGLLVAPNVEAWADAITIIQSPERRRTLGLAARNTVLTRFSAQAYQRRLTDVYLRLVGPRPTWPERV